MLRRRHYFKPHWRAYDMATVAYLRIPTAFIETYRTQVKDWALSGVERITIGGFNLVQSKNQADDQINVVPGYDMDEFHLQINYPGDYFRTGVV